MNRTKSTLTVFKHKLTSHFALALTSIFILSLLIQTFSLNAGTNPQAAGCPGDLRNFGQLVRSAQVSAESVAKHMEELEQTFRDRNIGSSTEFAKLNQEVVQPFSIDRTHLVVLFRGPTGSGNSTLFNAVPSLLGVRTGYDSAVDILSPVSATAQYTKHILIGVHPSYLHNRKLDPQVQKQLALSPEYLRDPKLVAKDSHDEVAYVAPIVGNLQNIIWADAPTFGKGAEAADRALRLGDVVVYTISPETYTTREVREDLEQIRQKHGTRDFILIIKTPEDTPSSQVRDIYEYFAQQLQLKKIIDPKTGLYHQMKGVYIEPPLQTVHAHPTLLPFVAKAEENLEAIESVEFADLMKDLNDDVVLVAMNRFLGAVDTVGTGFTDRVKLIKKESRLIEIQRMIVEQMRRQIATAMITSVSHYNVAKIVENAVRSEATGALKKALMVIDKLTTTKLWGFEKLQRLFNYTRKFADWVKEHSETPNGAAEEPNFPDINEQVPSLLQSPSILLQFDPDDPNSQSRRALFIEKLENFRKDFGFTPVVDGQSFPEDIASVEYDSKDPLGNITIKMRPISNGDDFESKKLEGWKNPVDLKSFSDEELTKFARKLVQGVLEEPKKDSNGNVDPIADAISIVKGDPTAQDLAKARDLLAKYEAQKRVGKFKKWPIFAIVGGSVAVALGPLIAAPILMTSKAAWAKAAISWAGHHLFYCAAGEAALCLISGEVGNHLIRKNLARQFGPAVNSMYRENFIPELMLALKNSYTKLLEARLEASKYLKDNDPKILGIDEGLKNMNEVFQLLSQKWAEWKASRESSGNPGTVSAK